MQPNGNNKILNTVRQHYAKAAKQKRGSGCCHSVSTCCETKPAIPAKEKQSANIVYSKQELADLPEDALMGLGCGNPGAIAAIKPGETVLDLGSGGGIDCFLAAQKAGEAGHVIGVDMTPEMVGKARNNALKSGYKNIEFRLGEVENLPVADASIDVVISNCVINLSPDKPRVFAEAFRVLKPGGRLAIADMVATAELPAKIRNDLSLYVGCIAGAVLVDELKEMLNKAGFDKIKIRFKDEGLKLTNDCVKGTNLENSVAAAMIEAAKP